MSTVRYNAEYTRFAGVWGIECMTNSHFVNGMTALYAVNNSMCDEVTTMITPKSADVVRTFYIGATEIEWDFAPTSFDFLKNESLLIDERFENFSGVIYRLY